MLRGFLDYLDELEEPYSLMAPTGRAAKILRMKTGRENSFTIHKSIYQLERIETPEEDAEGDSGGAKFKYIFPVRKADHKILAIVDEASMISSKKRNRNCIDLELKIYWMIYSIL